MKFYERLSCILWSILSYHMLYTANRLTLILDDVTYTIEEAQNDAKIAQLSLSNLNYHESLLMFTFGMLKKSQTKKLYDIFPQFLTQCKNLYGNNKNLIKETILELFAQYMKTLFGEENNQQFFEKYTKHLIQPVTSEDNKIRLDVQLPNNNGQKSVEDGNYKEYLKSNFLFLQNKEFKPLLSQLIHFFKTLETAHQNDPHAVHLGTESFAKEIINNYKPVIRVKNRTDKNSGSMIKPIIISTTCLLFFTLFFYWKYYK